MKDIKDLFGKLQNKIVLIFSNRWKELLLVSGSAVVLFLYTNTTVVPALPRQLNTDYLGVTQSLPKPIYNVITTWSKGFTFSKPDMIKPGIEDWHSSIDYRLGEAPIVHCGAIAQVSVLSEFLTTETRQSLRLTGKTLAQDLPKCVAWRQSGTTQICTKAECTADLGKNSYDTFGECPLPKVVGGFSGIYFPKGSYGICDCPVGKELRWNVTVGWTCINNCDSVAKVGTPSCANDCPECPIGNPTLPRDGIKVQTEVDFIGSAQGDLNFYRTFRSGYSQNPLIGNLGWKFWYHNYGMNIQAYSPEKDSFDDYRSVRVHMVREDGSIKIYSKKSSVWTSEDPWDRNQLVEERLDTTGTIDPPRTSWTYINNENDTIERYDRSGQLWYIQDQTGLRTYLYYSTPETSSAIAPRAGLLISVISPYGRNLQFIYDAYGRLSAVIPPGASKTGTPAGSNAPLVYKYDEAASLGVDVPPSGQLTSVVSTTGLVRRYHYEDKVLPLYLSGITNESRIRVGTYRYNSSLSNPTVRQVTQINGANKVEFNYYPGSQVTTTTDYSSGVAIQSSTTYGLFGPKMNKLLPISTSAKCSQCSTTFKETNYSPTLLLPTKTIDHDGIVRFKSYDTSKRLALEAAFPAQYAAAVSRPSLTEAIEVFGYTYFGSTNLPTQISQPQRVQKITYNTKNQILTVKSYATSDKTGALLFNGTAVGPVIDYTATYLNDRLQTASKKIGGTAVQDYKYTYFSDGKIQTVTNNLNGKIATASSYDMNGRLVSGTDFYGNAMSAEYYSTGLIKKKTVGTSITQYKFLNDYLLKEINFDGKIVELQYDTQYKLVGILINGTALALNDSSDPNSEMRRNWVMNLLLPEANASPLLLLRPELLALAVGGLSLSLSSEELKQKFQEGLFTLSRALCKVNCSTLPKATYTVFSWMNSVAKGFISNLSEVESLFRFDMAVLKTPLDEFSLKQGQYMTDVAVQNVFPEPDPDEDPTITAYFVRFDQPVGNYFGLPTDCLLVRVKKQCGDMISRITGGGFNVNEVVSLQAEFPAQCAGEPAYPYMMPRK